MTKTSVDSWQEQADERNAFGQSVTVTSRPSSRDRKNRQSGSLLEIVKTEFEANSEKSISLKDSLNLENKLDCCTPEVLKAKLENAIYSGSLAKEQTEHLKKILQDPKKIEALIKSEPSAVIENITTTGDLSPLFNKLEKLANEDPQKLVNSNLSNSESARALDQTNPVINESPQNSSRTLENLPDKDNSEVILTKERLIGLNDEQKSFKQLGPNDETKQDLPKPEKGHEIELSRSIIEEINQITPNTQNTSSVNNQQASIDTPIYKEVLKDAVADKAPASEIKTNVEVPTEKTKTDFPQPVENPKLEVSQSIINQINKTPLDISNFIATNAEQSLKVILTDKPEVVKVKKPTEALPNKVNLYLIPKKPVTTQDKITKLFSQVRNLPKFIKEKIVILWEKLTDSLNQEAPIKKLHSKLNIKPQKELPNEVTKVSSKLTTVVIENNTAKTQLNPYESQSSVKNLQNDFNLRLTNITDQNLAGQAGVKITDFHNTKYFRPQTANEIIDNIHNKPFNYSQNNKTTQNVANMAPTRIQTNVVVSSASSRIRTTETILRLSIVNNISAREIQKLAQMLTSDKVLLKKFSPIVLKKLSEKLEMIIKNLEVKDGKLSLKEKKLLNLILKELQQTLGKDADKILKGLKAGISVQNKNQIEAVKIDKDKIVIKTQALRIIEPKLQLLPPQLQSIIAIYLMQQLAQFRSAQDLYEMIKEINSEWAEMLKELDLERLLSAGVEFVSDETMKKRTKKVRVTHYSAINLDNNKNKRSSGKNLSNGMTAVSKLATQVKKTTVSQKAESKGLLAELIIARIKSDDKTPSKIFKD